MHDCYCNRKRKLEISSVHTMGNKQSSAPGSSSTASGNKEKQTGFDRVGIKGNSYAPDSTKKGPGGSGTGRGGGVVRPSKPVKIGKPVPKNTPRGVGDSASGGMSGSLGSAIDQFGNDPLSVQGTHLVIPSPRKVAPSPSNNNVTPSLRAHAPLVLTVPVPVVHMNSSNMQVIGNSTHGHGHNATKGDDSPRPASPVPSTANTRTHNNNNDNSKGNARHEQWQAHDFDLTQDDDMNGGEDGGDQPQSSVSSFRNSRGNSKNYGENNTSSSSSSSSSSSNNNNNITKSTALATEASTFDFSLTEGQTRRTAMADCEFECSEVVPGLYVGGASVATNRATLQKHNIRHIVNCAASVVPCPFINETYADADTDTDEQKPLHFNYKLLKMVDGRQDDISWFVCEVLHFILAGRQAGHNVLVHCEKGISRSCSYVIAFLMWQHRLQWKTAFEYVKEKRHVCNPNTAFTCNLIEVGDLMHGQKRKLHAFFRLATHLPHDMETPVLKCMRDINTRKLLLPNESYLDPQGIFVLRPGQLALFDTETDNNANTNVQRGMGPFVWIGSQVAAICPEHAEIARKLASFMAGVFTHVDSSVTVVWQGKEPPAFLVLLQRDGKFSGTSYEDLYSLPIISLHTATSTTAQADRSKIDLSKHQFRSRGTSPVIDASSTVKPKPSKPSRLATASSSSPTKTGVRQIDDESVSVSVCVSRTDTGIPVKESSRSDTSAPITLIAGTPPLPVRPSSSHSRPNSGAGSRPNSGATPISMRARSSSSDSTHGHDVSLLSPQQRRTPSPAGMTIPRTPSAGKLPADITLVREPTPVEDLQSETDNGTGNGTGAGIADKNIGSGTIGGGVALLHAHAEIAAASVAQPISVSIAIAGTSQHHSHNNNQNQSVKSILSASSTKEEQNDNDDDECTKPKLYVCIDKEIGIGNEWQAMGVYDDEDLEEALLLLLHCNNGGPHMIWVGEQYDADHENTCIEDETLLEWVCSHVEAGENHKWRDIFPCDMKVQRSGEEDEAFWDLFNEGF